MIIDAELDIQKNLKIETEVFEQFCEDFQDEIDILITENEELWQKCGDFVHGMLCDEIQKGEDEEYIVISVRDENYQDFGYIHVYGWKKMEVGI